MTVQELENIPMSPALAYVLGLIFPLYKEVLNDYGSMILGCVSHNPQPNKTPNKVITADQLRLHWSRVYDLLNDIPKLQQSMKKNDSEIFRGAKLKPWGFSLFIQKNNIGTSAAKKIIHQRVDEISKTAVRSDIKKMFIRGCFDGRSSVDDNAGLLAVDMNLNEADLSMLNSIMNEFNLKMSNNHRNDSDPRNFQFRIKRESLRIFRNMIGLFSERRLIDLDNFLGPAGR